MKSHTKSILTLVLTGVITTFIIVLCFFAKNEPIESTNSSSSETAVNNTVETSSSTPPSSTESKNEEPANDGYITYAEYLEIKDGMTYEEVYTIIGSYGKELSRASIAGYETVLIAWEGKGMAGANANITFQNGK